MRKTLTILAVALAAAGGSALFAAPYQLDPAHSHLGFTVRHLGIVNVRGEFKQFAFPKLDINAKDPAQSSLRLEVETASIFTDNERRDGHLRTSDFLDVENHPKMVFESERVEKTGDGEFLVHGNLTLRGVTKPVAVEVELAGPIKDPWGHLRIGAEGRVTINRMDYGVAWDEVMETGGLLVSEKVKIQFAIEATKVPEPPAEEDGR